MYIIKIHIYVNVNIYISVNLIKFHFTGKKLKTEINDLQQQHRSRRLRVTKDDTRQEAQNKEAQKAAIQDEISEKQERYNALAYTQDKTPNLVHNEMNGHIHTRVFNNNYDISYGYISCAIPSEQMSDMFNEADITKRKVQTQTQNPILNDDMTTKEDKTKCKYSKELLRTIANCFDTPVWGTCTGVDVEEPCLMPNSRRTPNCLVAVVPDNNIVDLHYPIFITEVIGKKPSKGENEEKYDGYNATMQSLVFAPHAYYCEVYRSNAKLYTLLKEPHKGYIRVYSRNYRLYDEGDFKNFLKDICAALIDAMVKLYPIAQYTAACLKTANHRDFLNIPSKRRKKIEPHCWHLFVPKFLNQDRADVPGDFLATVDFEDPAKPDPKPTRGIDYLPSISAVESLTYPVDEHNIDISHLEDLTEIRAVRDEDGKPVKHEDMTDTVYNASLNVTVESRVSRLKKLC